MIVFCLTLYFQPTKVGQSISLDHYSHLDYHEENSHSLSDFNKKIAPYKLEEIIQERLSKNKMKRQKTRVMEIGFGNGRVLMELKKLFPDIEFYGINKEKTHTFYRRESFIHTALKFEIMSKEEAEENLPYVVFKDLDFGNHIPYNDSRFDVIFSQHTLTHLHYSVELINETLRVLKTGGTSIHSDLGDLKIYDQNIQISLKEAAVELRKKGFAIHANDSLQMLRVDKTNSTRSSIPLVPLTAIPQKIDSLPSDSRKSSLGYQLKLQ